MARFDTSGFDDLIQEVTAMGERAEAVGTRMLQAGAKEVKKAWRAAARQHKLRDTGDMIDSIGYAGQPKLVSDIKIIDIYPQGKDRKGVRNVEKAFLLHYGTSSAGAKGKPHDHKKYRGRGIPATHWVDDADKLAAEPVQQAMEHVWDDYLKGGSAE